MQSERAPDSDAPRRAAAPEQQTGAAATAAGAVPVTGLRAAVPSPSATSLGARQVRAKSVVGAATDPAEREADHAADRALRMAAPEQERPTAVDPTVADATSKGPGAATSIPPGIQRSPADPAASAPVAASATQPPMPTSAPRPVPAPPSGATPATPIRSKGVTDHDPHGGHAVPTGTERYLDQSQGTGSPLPDGTRRYFETRFSTDFRAVRVHDDAAAGQAARSLGALAFTRGRDIWFSAGAYDTVTDNGRRLLAHELAHIAQQNPGIGRMVTEARGRSAAGPAPVADSPRRATRRHRPGNGAATATIAAMKALGSAVAAKADVELGGASEGPIVQRQCSPGCTNCTACRQESQDQGDKFSAGVQRSAVEAEAPQLVQRQDAPSEGEPGLVKQLEDELDTMERDAGQNDDPFLRAYANRAALLMRVHPQLTSQKQLDEFIGTSLQLATTEMDTLNSLDPAGAELALMVRPKGFPLTWSGRIHAALTLGIDPVALLADVAQQISALSAEADQLPPRLAEKGLPVPLAEVDTLTSFELRVKHVALPQGNAVGDFARATAHFAQFKFLAAFAWMWEKIANDIAEAVADGTIVPVPSDYDTFVKDKQEIVRSLPDRARNRLATSEADLAAIERDAFSLEDAAIVAGFTGALVGLFGIFDGWNTGSAMFDAELKVADGLVGGAGVGERISMAFRWLWEAGYLGDAFGEALRALIASGPAMLKELGTIVVLQMIPFVDVALDIYLEAKLGADIISVLFELRAAFNDVTAARSMIQMQRAAARMARALVAGGIQILTLLLTFGIVKGVKALRDRAAGIQAAEPGLSDEEAMRRAMREAPEAERAPLEATLSPWERDLNAETQELLRDRPDLRRLFQDADPQVRRILTHCASLCIPANATAEHISRIHDLLLRMRTLRTVDELMLNEYFYARRSNLEDAIARIKDASGPGHLRKLLRADAAGRSAMPLVLTPLAEEPGHGLPGRWGDPKYDSYGHSLDEHGADLDPNEFRDRAMSDRREPDSQFYDNRLIVEAEQRAPVAPGAHEVEMFRPIGRVFLPDGSVISDVTRVLVVRLESGELKTAYPIP